MVIKAKLALIQFAVKELAGAYYNLDSKLEQPEIVGSSEDLLRYLQDMLDTSETQIFVVADRNTVERQTYVHPPYREEKME